MKTRLLNTFLLLFFILIQGCGTSGTSTLDGAPTVTGGSAPFDTGYNDDFNDNSISSIWTQLDKDNFNLDALGGVSDDESTSFQETGGQLQMQARGDDIWTTTHEFVSQYINDYAGDFDVAVEIVSRTTGINIWSKTGIIVANDVDNFASGGYAICALTETQFMTMQYDSAEDGNIDGTTQSGDSNVPKFVRMVKSGANISCYYGTTSVSGPWTQFGGSPVARTFGGTVDIGLATVSHDAGNTITVIFDDWTFIEM